MSSPSSDEREQAQRAREGDKKALGALLEEHRDRLRHAIRLRIDRRVSGRIDPSDVIQETMVEATKRFDNYAESNEVPFFVWLRFLAMQKLMELHRHHLGTQMRAADREISLNNSLGPQAESSVFASHLADSLTSPSKAVIRAETHRQVEELLEQMDSADREILVLRHIEEVSNREAAKILGLSDSGATRRYGAALLRLKALLAELNVQPPTETS